MDEDHKKKHFDPRPDLRIAAWLMGAWADGLIFLEKVLPPPHMFKIRSASWGSL